ncbi:MAG: serine protease [Thermoanaerobaculia bacterium]
MIPIAASTRQIRRLAVVIACIAGILGVIDPGPVRGASSPAARLVERLAPAIVGVRVVLKTEFNSGESTQDQESTLEARGVLVNDRGLVMLWNSQLSASRLVDALETMGDGGQFRLKMTPTDFRITLPGDPTEHPAFLAAADTDLDLAFLQIEAPPERPLPAIDFARSREPEIGQTVFAVSRLSPGFDRAPFYESSEITGRLDKPRRAWLVDLSSDFLGLPAFDDEGRPLGVLVTIFNRSSDGSPQGSEMLGFLSLGRSGRESGPLALFLLPATRVRDLVVAAAARANELLAERRAAEPPAAPAVP